MWELHVTAGLTILIYLRNLLEEYRNSNSSMHLSIICKLICRDYLEDEVKEMPVTRPIYLLGESLGGILALAVASQRADLVDRVVVVNPATSFPRSVWARIAPLLPRLNKVSTWNNRQEKSLRELKIIVRGEFICCENYFSVWSRTHRQRSCGNMVWFIYWHGYSPNEIFLYWTLIKLKHHWTQGSLFSQGSLAI